MARKSFYELLSAAGFNAVKEYNTLVKLFEEERCIQCGTGYVGQCITVKKYIQYTYFRELSFRGTYTDIENILSALRVAYYESTLDKLFTYCEFLVAVLPDKHTNSNNSLSRQAYTISQNIKAILDKTGYKLGNDSEGRVIIVSDNLAAEQAMALVDDQSVAINMLEYNHFALKGNLKAKREILVNIGRYIEPILKSKRLQKAGYKKLESDMGFLLNNFHVRHNNKDGANANKYIQGASDAELEEWYDRAYNMALAVIIMNEQIKTDNELDELKSNYNWH